MTSALDCGPHEFPPFLERAVSVPYTGPPEMIIADGAIRTLSAPDVEPAIQISIYIRLPKHTRGARKASATSVASPISSPT